MTWKLEIPLIASVLLFVGCNEPDEITVYTIPKETKTVRGTPPNDAIHNPAGAAAANAPVVDARMLAALVRAGNQAWSFKLRGEESAVSAQVEPFHAFIRSVQFSPDGKPNWTLPDDWTAGPGSQFSFATLQINSADGPLPVSVSPTIYQDRTEVEDALLNVNRWRGQLGLSPIQKLDDMNSGVEQVEVDGKTMYLVDIVGKMRDGATGGPMFGGPMSNRPRAGGANPNRPTSPANRPPPATAATDQAAPDSPEMKPDIKSEKNPEEDSGKQTETEKKPVDEPAKKPADTPSDSADSSSSPKE